MHGDLSYDLEPGHELDRSDVSAIPAAQNTSALLGTSALSAMPSQLLGSANITDASFLRGVSTSVTGYKRSQFAEVRSNLHASETKVIA